jgi:hypothetical protein
MGSGFLSNVAVSGTVTQVVDLGGIRDTPRPAYLVRNGSPGLLVTPGADIAARSLRVIAVDPTSASATDVAQIDRFSEQQIGAIRGALVGGSLYVAWLDLTATSAVIRAAVIPEP